MIVPFAPFEPDKSRFNPSASTYTINVKPTADGYGPLPSLSASSSALAAAPLGAVAIKNDAGTVKVFAGTSTKLYELNNTTLAWTDVTRSSGGDYSVSSGDRWVFTVFGQYLIACQDGDNPQFVDLDASAGTNFANLTNASFQAKTCWTAGDFLVFGNLTTDQRVVKWSGINDITHWTNGEKGADEQILPEAGAIQAGIAQSPHAIVIQENKMSAMIFDPASDFTFRFETINANRGVFSAYSVVSVGPNDFVYLSKDGFFRGAAGTPIGAERVDRWFFDQVDPSKLDLVRGVADPFEKIVWWRYENESMETFLLGYDWQLDRWCLSDATATELLEGLTAGFTLEALDAFGTIDSLPASLDSRQWQGGSPGFAGFNASYEYGFFNGPNLAAELQTEDKQLNYPRRATTDRFAAMVDNNNFTISVAGKEAPADSPVFGDDRSPETNTPWCHELTNARYHRFKVKIPAGETWKNAVGVDVEFTDGGKW